MKPEDDTNDDLQDLLDQLDDDVVEQIENEVNRADDGEIEEIIENEVDEEPVDQTIEFTLKPLDTRQVEEISTVISETVASPTIDVVKYHAQLDQVTTEVLSACRADRQEAQDVIDLVRRQIDDAVNKNQSPQRMWVDGLVKAVEVKAGINATAVKIIEANAKMLAATRAGVNILNQNINTGSQDLEDVLSHPLTDLDEF